MEGKHSLKNKVLTVESGTKEGGSGISLYLGASAFFISVASVVFFYNELNKVKNQLGNVKQIKNQLENFENRFEDMDDQLKEILNVISRDNSVPVLGPRIVPSVKITKQPKTKIKETFLNDFPAKEITNVVLKEIQGEEENDSDNSEISYESDDESDDE